MEGRFETTEYDSWTPQRYSIQSKGIFTHFVLCLPIFGFMYFEFLVEVVSYASIWLEADVTG